MNTSVSSLRQKATLLLRTAIFLLLGLSGLAQRGVAANWVAFNDQRRGPGTHANATSWSLWGSEGSSGPLKDILTGGNLAVTLTVTNKEAMEAGLRSPPFPGTPAYRVFNGYVDFTYFGEYAEATRLTNTAVVGFVFSGLDPSKAYKIQGTAVRGTNYPDRWTLCELAGAYSFVPDHSAGVLTAAQSASLSASQAAFNSGNNTNGEVVGWNAIRVDTNGTFTVICRQYLGPIPDGVAGGPYAYGLTALRLEETEPPNLVLALGGMGDSVSIPSAQELQNPTETTLEAWVRAVANPLDKMPMVIAKGDGQSANSHQTYGIAVTPADGVTFSVFAGQSVWAMANAPCALGAWVHVAGIFSGRDGWLRLYTNGVLAAATNMDVTGTVPLLGQELRQTTLPVLLGCLSAGAGTFFTGAIDEVRIWSKARTPEEIYRDRYCRLTGNETNLAAYYNFENGAAADATGHGHDGTLVGNAHIEPLLDGDAVHAGQCGQLLPRFTINDLTAGGGMVMPDPFLSSFPMNSFVTLTATAAEGWSFLDWKGDTQGTMPAATLQMTCNRMIEARFGTPVTVASSGNGSASLSPASALYPYGTTVHVVAQPEAGSYFTGWSGNASGDQNPLNLVVRDANAFISATFAPLPAGRFALTVIPDGFGRIVVTPRANVYTNGQQVTLQAMPDAGQEFLGWSGGATGTSAAKVITMDASKTIIGRFTRRPTLNLQPSGPDGLLLTVTGEFGSAYRLLTSTNLSDWEPFLILTNSYGKAQAIFPLPPEPCRFYRAMATETNAPGGMVAAPAGSFPMGD